MGEEVGLISRLEILIIAKNKINVLLITKCFFQVCSISTCPLVVCMSTCLFCIVHGALVHWLKLPDWKV